MKEIEILIDTEEMIEYFFKELIKRGYVLKRAEAEELADITFDYLIEKGIIEDETEE